ncbi:protein obstructor-E [Frankliniella occidentalis]|uniref:Protein obstructor-E n=1 Tax=Frankliniella occidentalis TaxID=133901 RepID=A0A6J1TCT3_FRAOC|nr:protein obstructor-E [Frankliniella occidentalis]
MARHTHAAALLLALLTLAGAAAPPRKQRPGAAAPAATPAPAGDDADGDLTDECPEPNGYFADAYQCDKYYECKNGKITEKLCPDGMVFNDYSSEYEKCDLPFNIDCSKRPEKQTPKPSLHCERQNGYFAHEEANVCDKFYFCVDGKSNMITCPSGLVYSEATGTCTWPDEAKKKGCSSQEVLKFTCPNVTDEVGVTHPRYADPEDCQYFYVCVNGKTPRRSGCKRGQVFSESSKTCDWPRKVPECKDWYKGVLTDQELEELENPKPKKRDPAATAARHGSKGTRSRPKTTAAPKPAAEEDDEEQ